MLSFASCLPAARCLACAALLFAAVAPAHAQFPRDRDDPLNRTAAGALQQTSPFLSLQPTGVKPVPRSRFTPGYVPGPGYGGYPGWGYPAYPIYGPVNVFYGGYPYYPPVGPYVERQVIVVPPGAYEGYPGQDYPDRERIPPGGNAGAPAERAPARKDDFYLTRPRAERLADALADIRRAWLNGDFSRLKDRFVANAQVRLYSKGKFASSLSGADFARMTHDAISAIRTTLFEFDPVTQQAAERAFVTGRHAFTTAQPDGSQSAPQGVYISYTLELRDGFWRIVEAGSSPEPIRRHEE